ncbi:MAG: DsbA family protein [Steroidobacteraceae bacterium]
MTDAVLHYVFDPFCGWCYGAAPLVESLRKLSGLKVSLHGGGMMAGRARQQVTPQLRDYVLHHDQRIAQMSGQPFGEAYKNGLLRDTTAVFDSEPPTTAILAAEQLGSRGLDILKRIQHAHFIEGRKVADESVLRALAVDIGLEGTEFDLAYASLAGGSTQEHINDSRSLLGKVGGQGFPTFALVHHQQLSVLEFGRYLGHPDEWQASVQKALGT